MRCPQCGRWNRTSLPQCFYCGAPLPLEPQNTQPDGREQRADLPQPSASVIYAVTDDGTDTAPRPDEKDSLAKEMQSFHSRRRRGEEQQQRIRQEVSRGGLAPTTRSVRIETEPTPIFTDPREEPPENAVPEGATRPGAIPAPRFSKQIPHYGEAADSGSFQPLWSDDFRTRSNTRMRNRSRRVHFFGLSRFFPFLAVVLIIGAALYGGYHFILQPLLNREKIPLQEQVEIIPSLLGDMSAHTIRIPAEDGAQIYIKELRKSYIAAGGYAEITVADYTWYELNSTIEDETMDVTLTPYIKTSAGEQKLMDTITYTIDIPLSPLLLVTPDTEFTEVTTSPFNIRFRVAQNSTVFINGEDYSSYVNTQDGYISYNALVAPIGNNDIEIVVNCQYYRQNRKVITLYRAPQDIPLELSATLGSTSANQLMTIRGTTMPGAHLHIESDYENLDTSELTSYGNFSFEAKFNKIGNNKIIIVAEKDGLSTTLVKDIYYVPYASTYTPKAWPMNAEGYLDYLNNITTRVARTQIYECIGTITEILSSKPQLALMDTGTEGSERLVLLENMSTDVWEVGERYRIYADAYGIYDGKPRLVARYTYRPRK